MPFAVRNIGVSVLALAMAAGAQAPVQAQSGAAAEAGETDQASTIADLQRQIDELKAVVEQLKAAQLATAPAPAPAAAALAQQQPVPNAANPVQSPPVLAQAEPAARAAAPTRKAWYEKLSLRGYTQMRMNQIVSGDATAPAGISRLRTFGDSGVRDNSNFSLRRVRLVVQGDVNDHVSIYLQPDFAVAVSNQTAGERREGFVQLRDAYADVFPTGDKAFRIRLG